MSWATLAQARAYWPDAATLSDEQLQALLDDTTPACEAYAPALAPGDPVPGQYARANVLQAREVYAAVRRDGGDLIGFDSYAVRARPLSAAVQQLLRPTTIPRVG